MKKSGKNAAPATPATFAQSVSKTFRPNSANPVHALSNVSFESGSGEIVGLIGPNRREDSEIMKELGFGKTWMEATVFEAGREVGRFTLTPDMHLNETNLLLKLYELGGRKSTFSPGGSLPERTLKRIS